MAQEVGTSKLKGSDKDEKRICKWFELRRRHKLNCEDKQTKLPFPDKGSRAKAILELIHVDLCGPMEVKSIGNSKYFMF